MNIRYRIAFIAILLLCAVGLHAQTVTRHLSINPYGTDIAQGSSSGPGATYSIGVNSNGSLGAIQMPDPTGGISKFSFGFTLPDDYAPGTTFYLRVVWRSEAISCVVDLRNNNAIWASPGQIGDTGALIKESTMLAPNDQRYSVATLFRFNFVPQPSFAPGDSILAGLYRSSTLDSCSGTLYIEGLSIEYQALAADVFRDGFESMA